MKTSTSDLQLMNDIFVLRPTYTRRKDNLEPVWGLIWKNESSIALTWLEEIMYQKLSKNSFNFLENNV